MRYRSSRLLRQNFPDRFKRRARREPLVFSKHEIAAFGECQVNRWSSEESAVNMPAELLEIQPKDHWCLLSQKWDRLESAPSGLYSTGSSSGLINRIISAICSCFFSSSAANSRFTFALRSSSNAILAVSISFFWNLPSL